MSPTTASPGTAGPAAPTSAAWHTAAGIAVLLNLIGQLLIIITGGAVRLTGSGLGCSTWPQCEPGRMTPQFHGESSFHPYVEFGNRMLAVLLGLVALALVVLVWRARPRRSAGLRWLAAAPLIGVGVQGVIGGLSVRGGLHPAIVGSHFLISAALVWASALLWWRWRCGDGPVRRLGPAALRALGWVLAALTALIVILGVVVTGSGPHSGDEEVGYRFAVDPVAVTRLHSGTVWMFMAVLAACLVIVVRAARADPLLVPARRGALWVLAATLGQGAIGYYQYFNGLPELAVGLHMLGSGLLIVAVTLAVLRLRPREQPQPA